MDCCSKDENAKYDMVIIGSGLAAFAARDTRGFVKLLKRTEDGRQGIESR